MDPTIAITGFNIFTDMFADFNFVMKLFVFITIVSWVRNHFGNTAISWALIIGVSWFVLFNGWIYFGPIYIIYMLFGVGVTGILIDYFFLTQQQGAPSENKPDFSGPELQARNEQLHRASHMPLRPGPPI